MELQDSPERKFLFVNPVVPRLESHVMRTYLEHILVLRLEMGAPGPVIVHEDVAFQGSRVVGVTFAETWRSDSRIREIRVRSRAVRERVCRSTLRRARAMRTGELVFYPSLKMARAAAYRLGKGTNLGDHVIWRWCPRSVRNIG